jgi:hypothetical protein
MRSSEGFSRRRWLSAVAAAAATAGCVGTDDATPTTATGPCSDAFQFSERRTRLGKGVVPEVELQLENAGDRHIGYELLVVFLQGTSLGIDARTGRDRLRGRLAPGETVTVTATDDTVDIRNTQRYDLEATVSCGDDASD